MKLDLIMADPAGNRTIFVKTPVLKENIPEISNRLLSIGELDGEQVGFICAKPDKEIPHLQMMGGEFCGNAARSFGYLLCHQRGYDGDILISISGNDRIIRVTSDFEQSSCFADMPLPDSIRHISIPSAGNLPIVIAPGMNHVIAADIKPDEKLAKLIIETAYHEFPEDGTGVMFLNSDNLTPAVHVRATDTLYWERSCGSGSTACGYYLTWQLADGFYSYTFRQPGGDIKVDVTKTDNKISSCRMGGSIILEPPVTVEI